MIDRQIVAQIGDRAADRQNAGPVLLDSAKPLSLADLGILFAGLNVAASSWSIGALVTTVFGLDLPGAVGALLVGNTIAGLLLGLAASMGRVGAPQMFLARYSLGTRGGAIPASLNFVSAMGWFAVNAVSATLAAAPVLPALGIPNGRLSQAVILALATLPCVYLAVGSFDRVRRVQRWLVPALVLALVPISITALAGVDWTAPATGRATGGAFSYWTMWLTAIGTASLGYIATWSVCASDVTRFFRFDSHSRAGRPRAVVLVVAAASAVAVTWLELLGAAFASVARGVDPATHFAHLGPLAALVALFFLLGSAVSNNYLNLINGSLTAKAILRTGSRLAWTSAVAVVGALVAAYSLFVEDIATAYHTFLITLLIWQAPWLAILLLDYFVVRRRYAVSDLYRADGPLPPWRWSGLVAYAAGLCAAALFSFTGRHEPFGIPLYSPLMVERFNGADFSYVAGFATAALVYYALARPRRSPRREEHTPTIVCAEGAAELEGAELSRPSITTVLTGLFLVALFGVYATLTYAVTALGLGPVLGALPALVVGVAGVAGGLRLPRVVDRVIDRLDDRRLLQDTRETFSRAHPLLAVAEFLTRDAIHRLELTRGWLVLPAGLRAAWPTLPDVSHPAPDHLLLEHCDTLSDPVVLGRHPYDSANPVVAPWLAAGARVLVPLRAPRRALLGAPGAGESPPSARDDGDRLLGVWVVGAPRSGETLGRARIALLRRIAQSATLTLDHLYLAWEHQAHLAAEEANRVKSLFLATMSHELRTPLNAVIGFSEGLREAAGEDGLHVYADHLLKIETAGRHLLGLINNVLDLSRVEAGKMELHLEDVDLAALVREVATSMAPAVEQRENVFQLHCPDDLGLVRLDAAKLRQVLFNLLANAAKFTSRGEVTLSAARAAGHVTIAVRDTGIGIPPEQLPRLFQPFVQADSSITRRFGGTGLGLALSQRLCHLMGGRITVESAPDAGSTFTVELPLSTTAETKLLWDDGGRGDRASEASEAPAIQARRAGGAQRPPESATE